MRCRRPVDFILFARTEQRLVGLTRLGNKGAKWIGVTGFAAQSLVANLSLATFRPVPARKLCRVAQGGRLALTRAA